VDNELEVIHHQMEKTRASLADKLDTLENDVLGTVHSATSAVAHTVEDVKSAVGTVTESLQETVQSVKETFNLNEHVRRHPWVMLGGAVTVGFLGGMMLGRSRRKKAERSVAPSPEPPVSTWREQAAPAAGAAAGASDILQRLKGLAVGTLMNVVHHMIADLVPENIKSDVSSLMDDITVRLGGKPLRDSTGADSHNEATPSFSEGESGDGKRNQGEVARPLGTAQGESQEPVGKPDRRRASGGRR